MTKYSSAEAIEKAKDHPDWVFVARDGDVYSLNELWREWNVDNTGNYMDRVSAPFTAHRLIPAESEQISAGAAERLKVCGNCVHAQKTSMDQFRCYGRGTPYLPVYQGQWCGKHRAVKRTEKPLPTDPKEQNHER